MTRDNETKLVAQIAATLVAAYIAAGISYTMRDVVYLARCILDESEAAP
jgi:hypothetical protein